MNIILRNIFLLLIFFNVIGTSPYRRSTNRYGRGALAYSTDVHVRCFSGDSKIKLSNGEEKEIRFLKSGDQILTIDKSKLISTEFIFMLDKQISKKALFYTLKTESGYKISLTSNHLIPIKSLNKNLNYLFAKQIKIGDYLLILLNNKIEYSLIINITIEIKKGYYAPLTIQGTLLINHILASCFAYANDHHLAQFYMFPFRFYYKLTKFIYLNNFFFNNSSQGLNSLVSIMFHFARYFRPQTLTLL